MDLLLRREKGIKGSGEMRYWFCGFWMLVEGVGNLREIRSVRGFLGSGEDFLGSGED